MEKPCICNMRGFSVFSTEIQIKTSLIFFQESTLTVKQPTSTNNHYALHTVSSAAQSILQEIIAENLQFVDFLILIQQVTFFIDTKYWSGKIRHRSLFGQLFK